MLFIFAILIAVILIFGYNKIRRSGRILEARLSLVAGIVFAGLAIIQGFTIVPAGTVGVIDFLGSVSDNTLKPGVNVVNPMAKVVKYSFKTQEIKENMTVPSQEGLSVQLEISLLFSLDPSMANQIYKSVEAGDYLNVVLIPQFRSVVRGVTARYEAKALYTASREKLAGEIIEELGGLVGPRGVIVESAALREIILPPRLTQSIEEKLQAEQESQRMAFVLKKEEQEAQRKRIEAQGIADFQTIVSEGINEQLLRWKGIEATEKLATSNNSKIVVIGSGKDGLPIILGDK